MWEYVQQREKNSSMEETELNGNDLLMMLGIGFLQF